VASVRPTNAHEFRLLVPRVLVLGADHHVVHVIRETKAKFGEVGWQLRIRNAKHVVEDSPVDKALDPHVCAEGALRAW